MVAGLDLKSTRPGSAGQMQIAPMSARESTQRPATSGGFQHLSFDSSKGLGDKTADRERLRNKLVDVGQRFVGFEKVIEDDTLRRKMQEVKKFQAIQEGLGKLEKALNTEIRKRVDTNKQVQAMTENLANDMLERLQSQILIRVDKLSSSVEMLNSRVIVLEKGIAQFRGSLPTKLQVDTAALVKEISELRRQMENDRKSRIDRDTALLRRLTDMEAQEESFFQKGSKELLESYKDFKEDINIIARTQDVSDGKTDKFTAFILEEIASMKNTLAISSEARVSTDDKIVQAMNMYTNSLQKGLQTANSR
eukprot:TRINITY_DN79908_c0_g1_i1.p1 TRINITY_DN79908_c0_g1~~TRINITY_DN79908_c0_g1_i1.p1  ORF type:complete len:327 (+),score=49.99 TRINITY_DN79908_c0_g1_i1:60-983(+)